MLDLSGCRARHFKGSWNGLVGPRLRELVVRLVGTRLGVGYIKWVVGVSASEKKSRVFIVDW